MVAEFVDGGADGELTLRSNRSGFDRVTFRPRSLVDVANRSIATEALGQQLRTPVMLAPAGLARLVHPEGELAAARAAGRAGTVFVVSTASSYSIEEIAAVDAGPLWFQLYLWKDREMVASLVKRAENAGYDALCLTVDVPIVGKRVRDLRNGMTIPPKLRPSTVLDAARHPRWVYNLLRGEPVTFRNLLGVAEGDDAVALGTYVNTNLINASAGWDDLAWLRELWSGPLVVKGVLTAEDAGRAVEGGADGVIVSNHGGRQLDGAPASIDALPEIVAAVGERAEVFLDGGVRCGPDVVKAIALGARAVLVGRPWFWGLAAGGEEGVERMLEIFGDEIDRTLALIGRPTIADVDASAVTVL
jgi:L-lactate dehydrogenase (cytochrome)